MRLSLHLLRHGSVVPDTPWRFLGQRDVPLSDEGRSQAAAWRGMLREIPFSRVLCSDLLRCRETAALALPGREDRIELVPGLREIDLGPWDGLTREEIDERYPGQFAARGGDMTGFQPPGGESFAALQVRVLTALRPLLTAAKDNEEPILAVTHAGVIRVLLCHFLGVPLKSLFQFSPGPCSRAILEWSGETPRLIAFGQPAPGFPQGRG